MLVVGCPDLCIGMDSEADAKPQIQDIIPEAPAYRHIQISHRAFSTRASELQLIAVSQYTTRSTAMAQLAYITAATAGQADPYRVSTQAAISWPH